MIDMKSCYIIKNDGVKKTNIFEFNKNNKDGREEGKKIAKNEKM